MKKTILIILLNLLLPGFGYAQNNVIAIMAIPKTTSISLLKPSVSTSFNHSLIKADNVQEAANTPLLFFNNQQLLKQKKVAKKPVTFFADISFSDVLQTSVNTFKTDLINTYDDHITELFKDAPSLVRIKCIIPL
jgi:hypothetical protein